MHYAVFDRGLFFQGAVRNVLVCHFDGDLTNSRTDGSLQKQC